MLVWVLHVPQANGSVLVKACSSIDEASSTLRKFGVEHNGKQGPIKPRVGDFYKFSKNGNEVAYVILGQVHFN